MIFGHLRRVDFDRCFIKHGAVNAFDGFARPPSLGRPRFIRADVIDRELINGDHARIPSLNRTKATADTLRTFSQLVTDRSA
jgi:tRNA G37 N-methylase TrmD